MMEPPCLPPARWRRRSVVLHRRSERRGLSAWHLPRICLSGRRQPGSFVKRRRGLKREGDVSSKAPLLDTLPFAIMVFLWGQLFLGPSVLAAEELRLPMLALVLITPVLHRSFNLIGYKIGWKDVPY